VARTSSTHTPHWKKEGRSGEEKLPLLPGAILQTHQVDQSLNELPPHFQTCASRKRGVGNAVRSGYLRIPTPQRALTSIAQARFVPGSHGGEPPEQLAQFWVLICQRPTSSEPPTFWFTALAFPPLSWLMMHCTVVSRVRALSFRTARFSPPCEPGSRSDPIHCT